MFFHYLFYYITNDRKKQEVRKNSLRNQFYRSISIISLISTENNKTREHDEHILWLYCFHK